MRAASVCVVSGLFVVSGCGLLPGGPEPEVAATTTAREEIYVFRTHRTSRTLGETAACNAAPFTSRQEDYYELYAVRVDDETGLITDTRAAPVPGFTACLGEVSPEGVFPMYAIGEIAGHGGYTGLNTCRIAGIDRPADGSFVLNCAGDLQETPEGYSDGFLTSSTLSPRGEGADVPGYTATSIVTLRLWKGE